MFAGKKPGVRPPDEKRKVCPSEVTQRLFNNTTTKLFHAKRQLKLAEQSIEEEFALDIDEQVVAVQG